MHLLESLMVAAVAQAQSVPAVQVAAASVAIKTNYVAGLCSAQDSYAGTSEWGQNRVIGVELTAMQYVREQLKRNADLPLAANVKVEKYPQHGKLDIGYATSVSKQQGAQEYWRYTPDPGYEHGNDHATFLVDVQGTPVRVVVVLKVRQQNGSDAQWAKICPPDYGVISNAVNNANLLSTWQRQSTLSAMLAEASNSVRGFQDLAGSSVGQTTGEGLSAQITLDSDAAGHGWYIDPTPLDNTDDYLPTSNPNIWQAKAGSDAAGKMDLLSVLLHEYGHALGLEHSADARDFMATTLTPGVRRLPSADELTLMSQLVAQLKMESSDAQLASHAPAQPDAPSSPLPGLPFTGLGLFALGRLRSDRYGLQTLFAPNGSVLASVPQYEVAANATLTNGSLTAAQGWATEGSVAIASGSAVMSESASSQTRLNQVFILGEHDRFLSFTLANIALDDQAIGPDDAFEVALLNANTGDSLFSNVGLTRTDAIINLQTNGAEFKAQGITCTTNADGSRTYLLDQAVSAG